MRPRTPSLPTHISLPHAVLAINLEPGPRILDLKPQPLSLNFRSAQTPKSFILKVSKLDTSNGPEDAEGILQKAVY